MKGTPAVEELIEPVAPRRTFNVASVQGVVFVLGLALFSGGFGLIWLPLGLIACGAVLMYLTTAGDRAAPPGEESA